MISRTDIQQFVDNVVRQFRPTKIILFGSHAYGRPTADSDVDLMLIMPHRGSSTQTATKIRLACPRSFPMDLLVRTPAEIRRRLRLVDPFIHEISTKGIVMHANHHTRMGG